MKKLAISTRKLLAVLLVSSFVTPSAAYTVAPVIVEQDGEIYHHLIHPRDTVRDLIDQTVGDMQLLREVEEFDGICYYLDRDDTLKLVEGNTIAKPKDIIIVRFNESHGSCPTMPSNYQSLREYASELYW